MQWNRDPLNQAATELWRFWGRPYGIGGFLVRYLGTALPGHSAGATIIPSSRDKAMGKDRAQGGSRRRKEER